MQYEQSSRGRQQQLSHIPKSIKKSMVKFAGRNIPGKSLCKGIRDTPIKKGVHAVVLKGGSTGKLSSISKAQKA